MTRKDKKRKNIALTGRRTESSKRARLAAGAWKKIFIRDIEVFGLEKLKEMSPTEKVIIATTHITPLDLPVAACALCRNFDVLITNQSVHHRFFDGFLVYITMCIAGKENFLSIDYGRGNDAKFYEYFVPMQSAKPKFNPDNFIPMKKALKIGKTILISAHNPMVGKKLPKGGIGAVYLSQISDATILPVAVNIKSKGPLNTFRSFYKNFPRRPTAEVIIGKPVKFRKLMGLQENNDSSLRTKTIKEIKIRLRKDSDSLMKILNNLLSEKIGR